MELAEKPRNFEGIDFKRWQQKMFFYLTTLCLQRFTVEEAPEVPEGTPKKECFLIVEAWKHSDFLCRNYILSGLTDDLYNVYSRTKTAKELRGTLERNLVGNPREWWMDSCTTRHVCANKELFSTFAPVQVEEKIYMANSATAKVEGIGKMCLKMTSDKVLTHNNNPYVPELWKNLISV
ncbi:hypothetical protein BC332_32403 [Capsicum chinense]|nr:hypothetical protein BC332_32403 [Capsicum chinense]